MSLPNNFELSLHEGAYPEGFKVIRSALTAFNEERLGVERKAAFMAASVCGEIIGGIAFYWYGESAVIDFVAIDKKWRRNGIGQKLMEAVEKELIQQGCRQIHVGTLASQAPDFYRKQGFEFVAKVPSFICEQDFLFFRKSLKGNMSK